MAKRKNGEGSWEVKKIKGVEYRYFRDVSGKYTYGKTEKEIKQKIAKKKDAVKNTSKATFEEYLNWFYDNIYVNQISLNNALFLEGHSATHLLTSCRVWT